MKSGMKIIAVCIGVFLAPSLFAAPPSTTCTVSATGVNFGNYDVFAAVPLSSTGTITITCDKNANVTISVGPSPTSGGFNPRQLQLAAGTDRMDYNLFTDAGGTSIWGDGTAGTATLLEKAKKNTPSNVIIYGTIPALQNLSAGLYGETVTVTIVW